MLVVDIGGGTTDCSMLLMGPQWRQRADRENSLLGHSGCRVGGNDLDIALAFKNLMPLLGMGGETEKGIALPVLPWWNAVAINDVPAQSDFYSSANGRLLNDLVRNAREADKVALLLKVWRQRLSYRPVRCAEESKIALSGRADVTARLPFISDDRRSLSASKDWKRRWINRWRVFWNRCNWRWTARRKTGCHLSDRRQRPFAID